MKSRGLKLANLLQLYLTYFLRMIPSSFVKVDETAKIIKCLETFSSWSGQSFNLLKSGCFFSSNIHGSLKAAIKSNLNMKELDWNTKYLGNNNPFPITRRKKDFEFIRRKIINCLEGWRAKLPSQSGRKNHVKHVVTSILLYSMAAQKIPIGICDEVEKLSQGFLWRGNMNKKKSWIPMA